MSNELEKLLEKLDKRDHINTYMLDYVRRVCANGMDTEMCHEAINDAILASEYGVENDEDFKIFFYIEHFVDLEAEEITGPLMSFDKMDLKKFLFSKRHDVDYSNLTSYRAMVLLWMKSKKMSKAAYADFGGKPFVYRRYDLDGWKRLAHEVNKLVALGQDRDDALITMAKNLDLQEREDFKAWYGFNFGNNRRLYNINDKIRDSSKRGAQVSDTKLLKVASIFEEGNSYWAVDLPKPKPIIVDDQKNESVVDRTIKDQKASDMNAVKTKMINRTFAIDKLLEKYRTIFTEEQMDQIEDALNVLRKKIRKLKTASIINDTMIKTASILKGHKFDEGASVLISLAAPPAEDAMAAPVEPDATKTDGEGPPRKPSPQTGERSIDELRKEDLTPILDKLYDVSVRLKRRNIVREIAEIDLNLYNLNISSFFPELTDAQAKLIEAFGYASNKIEDVIPKLRSVSTEPPKEYEPMGDVVKELGKASPKPAEKPVPKAAPATEAPAAPATPPLANKPQVK